MREKSFEIWMVAILLIGLVSAVTFHNNFIGRIGEALFIAAFISLFVEGVVRKKFAENVTKDVAPYLFTYDIPPKLRDEIFHIRRITHYRKNLEIRLSFKNLKEMKDKLILETSASFSMVNITGDALKFNHTVQLFEEKYGEIEPSKILGVSTSGEDIEDPYEHEDPDIPSEPEGNLKDRGTMPVKNFSKEVLIKPNKDNVNNRFWWSVREIEDYQNSDPFYLLEPTIGVTVTVAEKPSDLKVDVFFGHRKDAAYEKIPQTNPHTWKFKEAFLPLGSLVFYWKRDNRVSNPLSSSVKE